jgi:hypothetical protein
LKAKSAIFQSPYVHITLATPVYTELQDSTAESSGWHILVDTVQNGGAGAILATHALITGMMEEEIFDDPDFRAEYEHLEGTNDEFSQNEIDTINQPTVKLPDIVLATLQETPVTVLLGEISDNDDDGDLYTQL